MKSKNDTGKQVGAWVQPSGNPYASLSAEDDSDAETCSKSPDKQKHDYLRKLQNPYAYHAIFDDAEGKPQGPGVETREIAGPPRFGMLSKRDFQVQSRRIFLQYVPSEENRVLRTEHRDFLTRNESRSAEERYLLVEQLKKYDLTAAGNYRPHFNREPDGLTRAKLLEIERVIDSRKKK